MHAHLCAYTVLCYVHMHMLCMYMQALHWVVLHLCVEECWGSLMLIKGFGLDLLYKCHEMMFVAL